MSERIENLEELGKVKSESLYSLPEIAQRLRQLKENYPAFPYHQKSEIQAQVADKYGLPESASLEEVLKAEDLAWRRSIGGPITDENNERHLREISELHKKIVDERGFPDGATALDIISAEKEASGYIIRAGKWVLPDTER